MLNVGSKWDLSFSPRNSEELSEQGVISNVLPLLYFLIISNLFIVLFSLLASMIYYQFHSKQTQNHLGILNNQYEMSFWHDHSSPVVLFAAEFLLPGFSHKPGADTGSSSVFKEGVERCNHGTRHKRSSPMLCGVLMVKCCDLSLLDRLHTHTHIPSPLKHQTKFTYSRKAELESELKNCTHLC